MQPFEHKMLYTFILANINNMKNFTLALILFSINATLSGQCDVSNCVKVIIGLGANGQGQLTPELAVTNNIDTCDVVVQILDEDGAVAVPFMESINLDCDDLSFALTYVIMDTLSGLSCSGLLQIIDPFDACPPMPDCNNLLCNAQINVSLDPNGLAVLQPEYFTEGDSDYCETSIMLLDAIGNAVTPLSDSLIIDCNFLGAYSFEIHDTLNDNICWGTLVVQP